MQTSMKTFTILSLLVLTFFQNQIIYGQINNSEKAEVAERQNFRIMFYNTENLYDSKDDSLVNDDEFTPFGIRHWTYEKMMIKLQHTAKALLAGMEWNTAALIGMCEVENSYVIKKLIYETPLSSLHYRYLHRDSPDKRGVDVCLLYDPGQFTPMKVQFISIRYPFDMASTTRDILYVKGVVGENDTLHVFVNHWPSRFGGYLQTMAKRNFVAGCLRDKVDSLFINDSCASIVIMGDFNDEPGDESIAKILKATDEQDTIKSAGLYNLMAALKKKWWKGSHKFGNDWGILDQFIVSGSLLTRKTGMMTALSDATIVDASFLFTEENNKPGRKPFRTYAGPRYLGGYSDHLPIRLDLHY